MTANEQIEQVVLGACLIEDEVALETITSSVYSEHFSLDENRNIYLAISGLSRGSRPVNLVTVVQELHGSVSVARVAQLTEGLPRKIGNRAVEYISRLKEIYRKRMLAELAEELAAAAADVTETADSLIQLTQDRLSALIGESTSASPNVFDLSADVLSRMEQSRALGRSPGMSYGIDRLDHLTGGIMPGHQVVIGARSGVGKTTLMSQIVRATCRAGLSVDAFMLEPTRDDLLHKIYSQESGVDYKKVTEPWTCPADEWRRVAHVVGEVADWPLRIHDRSSMTLDEIVGLGRLGMQRYDSRLICVDYLQRVKIRGSEDVRLKIGRASTAFADLVKGTNTSSVLLSQLSRRGGVDTVPTMHDLRESGQIENDAHTIVLLHLDYDEVKGHSKRTGAILVPKQRFGIPCNIPAHVTSGSAIWAHTQDNQPQWQEKH